MEEFIPLLIIMIIVCLLAGPVALIISIVALKRTRQRYYEPAVREPAIERFTPTPSAQPQLKPPVKIEPLHEPAVKIPEPKYAAASTPVTKLEKTALRLEQRIGTQWILIAGIITVIVGVGFFLKYAYDNALIGPLGRVVIATVAGLIALTAGEVTRRRNYDIVAKGVTALGFAILYAAVFSAYRFYELIGSTPAFVLAILITAAAMLYAVSLNEVLIAVLSLLGGFLTPILVSTGQNLPMPLFIYVLILGTGAMLCAYYRRWLVINILAFAGTFALYAGWFEKFYRPEIYKNIQPPQQMSISLGWLGVFFAVYMVLPLLHSLINKVKAQKHDIGLILANAAITLFYLWNILFDKYRVWLAFCALALCAAHLLMLSITTRRCRDDASLHLSLLALSLFFLTLAVPLYLKMYAVAMAWAAEGIVLAYIGLRYRSIWTQLGAAIAFLLSFGQLLNQLPMHTAAFRFIFNPAFGTWCFAVTAVFIYHLLYRRFSQLLSYVHDFVVEISYGTGLILLLAAIATEWRYHCDYNIVTQNMGGSIFYKGMVIIISMSMLLFILRPLCPKGMVNKILAAITAAGGALFTIITFPEFYKNAFTIFANRNFGIAMIFVAGLFLASRLLARAVEDEQINDIFCSAFALAGIFVLWILLTQEIYLYWYCQNRYTSMGISNWKFLAQMYISVMWAIYGAILITVGFWRKIGLLRYLAMGLFAILLAKVFILDTSTVKSVYRIVAFLATGITLVGISYLYQFCKNKGFFEAISTQEQKTE